MNETGRFPPPTGATEAEDRGITVFAGRFGSGKTEVALNYARVLAEGTWSGVRCSSAGEQSRQPVVESEFSPGLEPGASKRVVLIDLDIVTPYFRSREMAERMRAWGVEVIAPAAVGQYLDTPAITPQILGAIHQVDRSLVLDVGGDPQGARALGQFSSAIRQRCYAMHLVVNPYRPFTSTLNGLTHSIAEIEAASRLPVTSLVSNPNLIGETTAERIKTGHAQIEAFARELNLPVAFVCIERRWAAEFGLASSGPGLIGPSPHAATHDGPFAQPVLFLERHFVMLWE